MDSSWSRIPPEIAHEIAGHNADDVATLHAMSLVSTTTRSLVLNYIFSSIHFACAEDFSRWLDMLSRTPALRTAVKKVKFSKAGKDWLRRRRGLTHPTPLHDSAIPPMIPALPSVRSVEWDSMSLYNANAVAMMVAYMALFPNVEKVHLSSMDLWQFGALTNLLGACGQLKGLSFYSVTLEEEQFDWEEERLQETPFDLTALEDLVVIDCGYGNDCLPRLMQDSRPRGLKTLSFGNFLVEEPYSALGTEKLLQFSALSLVNLVVDPTFQYTDEREVLDMFARLPVFPALESLTLWTRPQSKCKTDSFINGFKGAPVLTTLIFRLVLYKEDDEDDRADFEQILNDILPWRTAESMKTVLTRKLPRLQRIGFHFCIPGDSDMHFRRGLRRRMEQRLKDRLEKTGADIAELLQIEWLDDECRPVRYNTSNGKPPWKFPLANWRHTEPDTEASDCESEKSNHDDSDEYNSDGDLVIRVWTEAHERAYRREMLAECGIYSEDEEEEDW
ncbi:hypothetical protein B0H19DRAFT_1173461 [Mycena capillaripes]|nr:hypothetical protein B0H19DRAFT_1173461 [Mycena capillaripes]